MKGLFIRIYSKTLILFLCTYLSFFPAWATAKPIHAVTAPLAGSLPVPVSESGAGWSTTTDKAAHYLEVRQTEPKVVIEWQSFDIGAEAHTHFEQVQGGIALNRIFDNNPDRFPSKIFGKLTATGSIYLVNQNGILFGENSRVNLNSLVASSLNIKDEDFHNALWKYNAENYMNDPLYETPGDVVNKGSIEAGAGNRVFFLGADVSNEGTIAVGQGGRVLLSGTREFDLQQMPDIGGGIYENLVQDFTGDAMNTATGQILADDSQVGIYGKIVRHDGLIRALSTITNGSSIELVASRKVATGKGSTIDSGIKDVGDPVVTDTLFRQRKIDMAVRPVSDTGEQSLVEHRGKIDFPMGSVTMTAEGNNTGIYLAPDSTIDVSGSWVEKTAADMVLSAQMNSLELRDEFLQKNSILKGETVYFLMHEGVSIGNISEHIKNRPLSILDQTTKGGTIFLDAGRGDIIVDRGAVIDISGGGTRYSGGYVSLTKLVSDGRAYNLSEAPDYLVYDGILNYGENLPENRKTQVAGFTEGADAGGLSLSAGRIVFDGNLNARALAGVHQVNLEELKDALGYQTAHGTRIPLGGRLTLGKSPDSNNSMNSDPVVESIVIKQNSSSLPAGFDPETSPIPSDRNGETWLSQELINTAGLSEISLNALTYIKTEAGTSLKLAPEGSLTFIARKILHQGDIDIPSGDVLFRTVDNKTTYSYTEELTVNPDYVSEAKLGGAERIDITGSINTSGEKINNYRNFLLGLGEIIETGRLTGGSIGLRDETHDGEGVVLHKDSVLDVSGGYIIGTDNRVTKAGNAGSISIQGPAILLGGTLNSHSMVGQAGGTLTLHAKHVRVTPQAGPDLPEGYSAEDPLPEDFRNRLIIGAGQFEDTGFTHLSFSSLTGLVVDEGVSLTPSNQKLNLLPKGIVGFQRMEDMDLGSSSITLKAGSTFKGDFLFDLNEQRSASITIPASAEIGVAPEGSILLEGPGVDIAGTFRAPGGKITVNSKSSLDTMPLLIRAGAKFLAPGYNRPTQEFLMEQEIWLPEDGGTVSLSSSGTLIMEKGSLVDVTGSDPVILYRTDQTGKRTAYMGASEPGSISLSFFNSIDRATGASLIQGSFSGRRTLDYLRGASFSLKNKRSGQVFTPDMDMLSGLSQNGFDSLELTSASAIEFSGLHTLAMENKISIDAPVLAGTDAAGITLVAPWIRLANASEISNQAPVEGNAQFTAQADFIDVSGNLKISKVSELTLSARQDIRLSDENYAEGTTRGWSGLLQSRGNITLTAARVYPGTGAGFEVATDGKITILPSGFAGSPPVYSARGSLTLSAHDIEVRGNLTAPMGSITLNADETSGRIYLAQGSVLSVAGEMAVNYGYMDETNLKWYEMDKVSSTSLDPLIDAEPEKTILLNAAEVIGRSDAGINMEGGGAMFGYTFLPGVEGSLDPLSKSGRMVVIPWSQGFMPGKAIYLEENDLLPEGLYVVLPEQYAFVEGAYILESRGALDPGASVSRSRENYVMAAGYEAASGTGRHGATATLYTVRKASDVLTEAHLETASIVTGSAGTLKIDAATTVLNSTIKSSPLSSDYRGGIMALGGENIVLGAGRKTLGADFNFSTGLASEMIGKLYLDTESLSDSGLYELTLGTSGQTQTITFEEEAQLTGERISLYAVHDIHFNENAGIAVTGDTASISLISDEGRLVMDEGSFIRSAHLIHMDAQGLDSQGIIEWTGTEEGLPKTDKVLSLTSDRIYLTDSDHKTDILDGFRVGQALQEKFAGLDEILLTGRQRIGILGKVILDIETADFTADTPLLANMTEGGELQVYAKSISLLNSGDPGVAGGAAGNRSGEIRLNADRIFMGQGKIAAAGFQTIGLNSTASLMFVGKGSLDTGNGDLEIKAANVTGSYRWRPGAESGAYDYEALDFAVNAGSGRIVMESNKGTASSNDNIGGTLSLTARRIENSGTVNLTSGLIHFKATGAGEDDGIFMKDGALVSAKGTQNVISKNIAPVYDAGKIIYETGAGKLSLSTKSTTDVSAGSKTGNAGTIAVSAPEGRLDIQGTLAGHSVDGQGGTFLMDAKSFADVSTLVSLLSDGGFNRKIDMRVRTGDVSLDSNATAREFRLSVDEGNLNIGLLHRENDQGVTLKTLIDASSETGGGGGGRVELYAGKDLTLSSTTEILARGTGSGSDGGEIILGTGALHNGYLDLGGATIDLSSSGGKGGTLYLRAPRTADGKDIRLDLAGTEKGTVTGASKITVEAVKAYQDTSISSSDATVWKNESSAFMTNYGGAVEARLTAESTGASGILTVIPGMEIQSSTDLSINTTLDLTSGRFGTKAVAGAYAFRAAGNLNLNTNILDNPTSKNTLQMNTAKQTSILSLASGAVLSAADPFAVQEGLGTLTVKDTYMVYTEGGNINFASGLDTKIGTIANTAEKDYMTAMGMSYNLASYTGDIRGKTGGDLILDAGVIQTATGDITLNIGKDLILIKQVTLSGSVRTTGQPLPKEMAPSLKVTTRHRMTDAYSSGGNIRIQTGGAINLQKTSGASSVTLLEPDITLLNANAWDGRATHYAENGDVSYHWSANYYQGSATQGLATMGGGDLSIDCGKDFFAAAGTFNTGDFTLSARGDINGHFANKEGRVLFNSLGSIGTISKDQVFDAFDSRIFLQAQGDIHLGAVINPTIARSTLVSMSSGTDVSYTQDNLWDCQYSQTASLSLAAGKGSVTLSGVRKTNTLNMEAARSQVLPGSLYASAGKDLVFKSLFYMAPSASGGIELHAGRDIYGKSSGTGVLMSDADPLDIYGNHDLKTDAVKQLTYLQSSSLHAVQPLHLADPNRAVIQAGNDIKEIMLAIPKAASIQAGEDISGINFTGQNLHETDVTSISAEGSIVFNTKKGQVDPNKIHVGGPGLTLVQAGGRIDLGRSQGIAALGNLTNAGLEQSQNDLVVIAGTKSSLSIEDLNSFFGDTPFLDLSAEFEKSRDTGLFKGDADVMNRVLAYLASPGFVAGIDGLRQAGQKFERARSGGDDPLAAAIKADARQALIAPLFEGSGNASGDISLINSSIYTSGDSGDIFTLAKGNVNVGISTIKPPPILLGIGATASNSSTGFYTTAGGEVKVFAGRDVNVNESRVMTFDGGDIDIFSDTGNINAGRGSKVAVASSNSYVEYDEDSGTYTIKYEAPAVGSGVRAVAPRVEDAGDIYASAWEGDIDAGEAGIAGRNVSLAAKRVLNAQNIQATGISIGFAKPAESSGGITGLSGGGGLADAGLMSEESSALASARDRMNEETPEGYSYEPKWVDVQVIGFEEEDEEDEEDENNEDKEGQKT